MYLLSVTHTKFSMNLLKPTCIVSYVGCEPLPTAKQGRYTAAPGQFPIVNVHSEGVTSAKYTVTDLECEGGIYVVPRAVSFKTCGV